MANGKKTEAKARHREHSSDGAKWSPQRSIAEGETLRDSQMGNDSAVVPSKREGQFCIEQTIATLASSLTKAIAPAPPGAVD